MRVWPLTRLESAAARRAFRITIGAQRHTPPDVLAVHEGVDWLYVLGGTLRLCLGDHTFTIEPGGAAEFYAWTPHWLGAIDAPVELILVLGPQGERLHLH